MPDAFIAVIVAYIIALVIGIIAIALYSQRLSRDLKQTRTELADANGHLSTARQELAYAQNRLQQQTKTNTLEGAMTVLPQALIVVNTKGLITLFTPGAEKLTGIAKLDAVTRPYREVIRLHDADGTPIVGFIDKALAGQAVVLPPWTRLLKASESVPVSGSAAPVRDEHGTVEYILLFLQDLTPESAELKRLREDNAALQKTVEDQTRSIITEESQTDLSKLAVSEMHIGIICTDAAKLITAVNKHAEHFTGVVAAQVTGQPLSKVLRLTNLKDEEDYGILAEGLYGKTVQIPKWMFLTARGGGKRAIQGTVIPFHSENRVTGVALTFVDAQQVYEEELEEKAFFSGAAHDLRSPLTTIRGVIELLRDSYDTMDKNQVHDILTGAQESVVHLIGLVNDLLNVSRIEMGRLTVTREPFDMVALTKEVVEQQSIQAKAKRLFLTHDISGIQYPKALGDRAKSEEVLTNLISNAIKYTQQGGITVTHTYDSGKITTHIQDTGVGISPENQQLLFRKFQQVGQARQLSATKSTGLGLYIAKTFTDMMGGTLELVGSDVGKGSEFAFTLPAR